MRQPARVKEGKRHNRFGSRGLQGDARGAGAGCQLFERRNFACARNGIFRSARPDRPLALTEHRNRLAEASSERVVGSRCGWSAATGRRSAAGAMICVRISSRRHERRIW